jgi:hypothetical protein
MHNSTSSLRSGDVSPTYGGDDGNCLEMKTSVPRALLPKPYKSLRERKEGLPPPIRKCSKDLQVPLLQSPPKFA